MYPPPRGAELSQAECRALDEEYFSSDPTGYFRSRIDDLLDSELAASPAGARRTQLRQEFEDLAGPAGLARHPTSDDVRQKRVATDAIQLRHQAAEALLRLLHARLSCRSRQEATSLWLTLVRTPTRLHQLVEDLRPQVEAEEFLSVMAGLMIPLPNGSPLDHDALQAVRNSLHWVERAAELVSSGHIDLNAANNKIKHGITARLEDKLRLTLTTHAPDEHGNVPLSALTGASAFDVINTIALEYISQPPKTPGKPRPGFERTLLPVDTASVLAEAWMLALVHGAIFYTCGYRHNGEKPLPGVPEHPGLALGPPPDRVLGKFVGLRFPLMTSADGQIHRPAGLLLSDGSFLPRKFGQPTRVRVTDG